MIRAPGARAAFFVSVLLFAGGCDLATKQIAREALWGAPAISLAADTVRLQLTENPGGFLSLGAGLPPGLRHAIFLLVAPLSLLGIGLLVLRAGAGGASLLALGLIVGGGLANWGERVVNQGAVTDFLNVGIGPLRTGIFNLADVFVLAGVVLLVWSGFGEPAGRDEEEAAAGP
jgi:signal peptidase II